MPMIRQIIKFFILIFLIFSYFFLSCLAFIVIRNQWARRRYLGKQLLFFSRLALKGVDIEVSTHGWDHKKLYNSKPLTYLIVSNHLSYLDILIIATVIPITFVSTIEVKEDPFLGPLVTMGGVLFIERRSLKNLRREISNLAKGLQENLYVCIFPEATSTDGTEVLRFRPPLYRAAVDTGSPVLPICINYDEIENQPVTSKNRDYLCYYGEMSFFPHLWKLMKLRRVKVSLNFASPLAVTPETTASDLAKESHKKISSLYNSII